LRLQDIYDDDNAGGGGGWNELNEMVQDGDVSFQELEELYNNAAADVDGLDQKGFESFYRSIDDLFDDDDDDDDDEEDDDDDNDGVQESANSQETDKSANENNDNNKNDAKKDLVEYLEFLQSLKCDSDDGRVNVGERRPWGLDCSDKERDRILENVQALLDMDIDTDDDSNTNNNSNNLVAGGNANNNRIWSAKDLTQHILGTWDLKYTNSRTMIINKSLSGLGRSTSDLAFNLGLQMILSGTYYAGRAEFLESFGTTGSDDNDSDDTDSDNAGTSSAVTMIQATVTGEWILETGTRVDYKTGRPSVSLRVEVETIAYGSANTKSSSGADQWDSLSPIKLVDVLYLDRDLMVLRGYANKEALFVYTRQ